MIELAKRNHNVSVYTIFPTGRRFHNYHEIDIWNCFKKTPHFDDLGSMTNFGLFQNLDVALQMIPKAHELKNCQPLVQLIDATGEFDLLIIEPFDSDILSILAYKLGIPVIYLFPNVLYPWIMHRIGAPMNPSYNAVFPFLKPEVHLTFANRLTNFILYCMSMIVFKLYLQPISDYQSKLFFGTDVPYIEDVAKNVSLILSNTHFTYNPPIPMSPNVVQIGGINIEDKKILPQVMEFYDSRRPLWLDEHFHNTTLLTRNMSMK